MAGFTPDWESDSFAWDTLIIGTNVLPGVWDIEDGNVKRVLDVKKAPGRDGATIKDQGYENGALVCRGQMLAEHWETMQSIAQTLKLATKGKNRSPVLIHHPKALYLGITRVYIVEIEVPRIDNGIMTASIRVLEYLDKTKGAGGAKKSSQVSVEEELRRQREAEATIRPWVNSYLSEEQTSNQNRAAMEMQQRKQAGQTPNFTSNRPQYLRESW
jgi:hypothetical protein